MYSTLYHTLVVGLMAVCETHPLLSLPRSPFAQREQWLNPVIVRLVSLSRVTNIVWSGRPACTSHHQMCKVCAWKCVHLARAILRCARVVQGCKDCARNCVHLARATFISILVGFLNRARCHALLSSAAGKSSTNTLLSDPA